MTEVTPPSTGAPAELRDGDILSARFKVGAKRGSDGLGRLYAGEDTKTGREISLRQVKAHLLLDGVGTRLRKEVKTGGAVKHANVHKIFGVTAAPDRTPVLVQGPISGRNLGDYVRTRAERGTPVSLRGAYNVVAHVSHALEALHEQGPHGAVRPDAVWIADDGKISLMDWALARAVLVDGTRGTIDAKDAAYLAPEVRAGETPQPAADIFGLGALLYVLLTGRSPADSFINPSEAHDEADERVDAELLKALAPDPAGRHASPEEFRESLLPIMSGLEEATADDFGMDIEIEVNLSMAPSRPSQRPPAIVMPKNPGIPGAGPAAGMRVSIHETFRESTVDNAAETEAAEQRKSLGAIDLEDVLSKITENDSARWMLVKDGMDHGPFTGKQLVNMIVRGEALSKHGLMNMDTGERKDVKDYSEFTQFLAQYEVRRKEEDQKAAINTSETKERRSNAMKLSVGLAIVAVLATIGGGYLYSRNAAKQAAAEENLGDLYKRGEIEISGSAGILPVRRGRRGGKRSRRSGGGGGGGGGMTYEQAMMQAVDIGSAEGGGGEKQLSAGTVAGVMNKHLNGIYNGCVKGSVGKVKIDLAILGSGRVQGVSVRGGDGGFQKCVAGRIHKIHFPKFPAPRMGARYSFDT